VIHFIYGPCGSGKTTTLYKYLEIDAKQGKKAFFIVPEQETVAVERAIVSLLPYSSQLNVDVLNFSRLCNKIFRTCGGLSYNTATKTVKSLLMWKIAPCPMNSLHQLVFPQDLLPANGTTLPRNL
jgi:ATP-dependent helicase/nuclease subunit B